MSTLKAALLAATSLASISCAFTHTPTLAQYDLGKGYRFELLSQDLAAAKNSDELFVVLAFSGGGTRAAALSYGVLDQLRHITIGWNASVGAPCPLPSSGCEARTLLQEVDVISSVSGGSFTAAYYALNRDEIFAPSSPFHTQFLYYPIQRDLVSRAAYYPKSWTHLLQRVEIAADLYADRVFGDTTFAALESKGRPYLIMNATDASTGTRFEFSQEMFDPLCADLSQVPIARGVTASSAFPGLLNAMTIEATARGRCGYTLPAWVANAKNDARLNYRRYQAGRELESYLDDSRKYLHVMDGGPADNIGVRSILQSLNSIDRPLSQSEPLQRGGWSLLNKVNRKQVKTVIVISVNARTNRRPGWDSSTTGPIAPGSIAAAAGIPMGKYSVETLELLRAYAKDAELNQPGQPRFVGVEVAFENLPINDEREFFGNLGTNFELDRFEVNCLRDRGASLLRDSFSITENSTTPMPFRDFIEHDLHGRVDATTEPREPVCTPTKGKTAIGPRSHYADIGYQHTWTRRTSPDVGPTDRGGLAFRVTKPNGFGATLGYANERFDLRAAPGDSTLQGELSFRTVSAGVLYARRLGRLEASLSGSAGFGFGSFTFDRDIRDRRIRLGESTSTSTSNALVLKPGLSLWYNLTDRFAVTTTASYLRARTRFRVGDDERKLEAAGLRLSTGIGMKVF